MNLQDLSTQLVYTTAPVYAILSDNTISTGTGFIFSVQQSDNRTIPLLITNYHVVQGAKAGIVKLHISENGIPTKDVINAQFDERIINEGKLGDLDLVALPLAGAISDMRNHGKEVFFKSIDVGVIPDFEVLEDLAAIERVTFIGYPNSIYDTENQIPIVRQGITATPIWNDFQGKEEFLIDAGVFQGSSGSPVFIYNQGSYPSKNGIVIGSRILFVGVLKQTIQRKDDDVYLDLGVVINSKAFFREINNYIVKITGNPIRNND